MSSRPNALGGKEPTGLVPWAWMQAWRGSHIVITTIMFNFVASALMVYLMVNVLIAPGSMTPQSRNFTAAHDAVIRVCDAAGNVIETGEHKGDSKER